MENRGRHRAFQDILNDFQLRNVVKFLGGDTVSLS